MMKQPYRDIEPTIFTSIQLEQQQKIFSNKSTIHNELIFTISYHHHHNQKIVQMFNNNNLLFIKIMTNNIHPPSKKNITYSFPILLNNYSLLSDVCYRFGFFLNANWWWWKGKQQKIFKAYCIHTVFSLQLISTIILPGEKNPKRERERERLYWYDPVGTTTTTTAVAYYSVFWISIHKFFFFAWNWE